MQEPYSWIARFSHLGTQLFTLFSGELVGKDSHGNKYFRQKKQKGAQKSNVREKRWVIYNGRPEASLVPPEWHGWLHYTLDEPLPEESDFHQAWVKQHHANLTFSDKAYRPPVFESGKRDKATGDYQAWQPNK
ncbi:MAG: NADH:ubiquinone oxidoreductase subunit NDUFA12 [Alphaproteobacteria bacterium]|nr:NADH:ubiquinone oxidoreductase subunit NDUFA12 [Alphaproteobacteria bacterium]